MFIKYTIFILLSNMSNTKKVSNKQLQNLNECEEKEEITHDDTQVYSSMTGLPDQRKSSEGASNNVFYPS